MPDLGISVLLKGKNMIRLLGGLWVALKISLISVVISIPLGILLGIVMTWKNPVTKAVTRVYLEIVRIMPQMVLLFLVFFGTTRMFGWNLSAEFASVIVFTFWGTAEMGDLVRGALISRCIQTLRHEVVAYPCYFFGMLLVPRFARHIQHCPYAVGYSFCLGYHTSSSLSSSSVVPTG